MLSLAEKLGAESDWILAALLSCACRHQPKLAESALKKTGELRLLLQFCRVGGPALAPALVRCLADGICLETARKGLESLGTPNAIISCLGEMEIWTPKGRVDRSMWKRPKARSLVACLVAPGLSIPWNSWIFCGQTLSQPKPGTPSVWLPPTPGPPSLPCVLSFHEGWSGSSFPQPRTLTIGG